MYQRYVGNLAHLFLFWNFTLCVNLVIFREKFVLIKQENFKKYSNVILSLRIDKMNFNVDTNKFMAMLSNVPTTISRELKPLRFNWKCSNARLSQIPVTLTLASSYSFDKIFTI